MIWHPLLLAVLVMDFLSLLLIMASAVTALRTILGWSYPSASREQIQLEIKAETAAILTRWALAIFFASSIALIIAITNVLPAVVPGAMCGTGVLQATHGLGSRALAFRLLAFSLAYFWHVLDQLNRIQPDSPLATATARIILLLTPVFFLAFTGTTSAVFFLDVHQPVDCCAVVYDQVRSLAEAKSTGGIPDIYWIGGFILGGVLTFAVGLRVWMSKSMPGCKATALLAALSLAWLPVASVALIRTLAAYYYGVLEHHCPWCLFLFEHHLVGYPLFGALAVAGLEGCACHVSAKVAETFPLLRSAAIDRSKKAGLRVAVATVIFLILGGLPPLVWRLRFGVWMS